MLKAKRDKILLSVRTCGPRLSVAVPFPSKGKRRRGIAYVNLTLIMFRDVTLLQENI